jgi:hypothetical protein
MIFISFIGVVPLVQAIGPILVSTMVSLQEEQPHQDVEENDSHPEIKDPSFCTDGQVGKFATQFSIEMYGSSGRE